MMRKNYFWGVLFIVLGVAFIAKKVLFLHIPIMTLIFSFILIWWGISLISGKPRVKIEFDERDRTPFSFGEMKATDKQNKYDIIFSNSTVDLTTLPIPLENKTIKIDTVFARSLIKINPDVPAVIKISSAFAAAHLPNNSVITFGEYTYVTRSYREGMPHLYIKTDVVFGNTEVIEVGGMF